MNKVINSRCICNQCLIWKRYPLIMNLPCEHILHKSCQKSKKKCDICNESIKYVKSFDQIKRESKHGAIQYQRYIDMIACSNFDHMTEVNNYDIIHISHTTSLLSSTPFMKGYNEQQGFCREILKLLNTKLIIKGSDNIVHSEKKVYISNHTTFIDPAVINSIFKCGYVVSSLIEKSYFGRLIKDIIPLLIIDRDKKGSSTVDQMTQYMNKYGSLCLFPEGMVSHPDVIQRFRTGAFYTGYPVQPIVIKYDKHIYDDDITKFMQKIVTNSDLTITVHILKTEYPPFNDEKIEEIRSKMAKVGNLGLSRVSNRDIKEIKEIK